MTSRSRVDDRVVVVPGILGSRPTDAEVPPDIPGHDRVAVFATAGNGPVRTPSSLGGGRCPARPAGPPAGPHRVRASTGNAGHVVMTALVLLQESGSDDGE
ncbi:hypothetical protein ACFXPV_25220 [Streptomyces sp. NPDC059118]|uniref:hypothetical protein n=1 Tax=unclassified Streptomyces TaxID=2593676 RepID=UPI0036A22F8F